MQMNKTFFEEITGLLEEQSKNILERKKISGVDQEFCELTAEILGRSLKKKVWLLSSDDDESSKLLKLLVGDTFHLQNFLELGYQRVERVWNEGEISILGDVIIIWPFSMNSIVRVSLDGEKIEEIAILDIATRKKLKSVKERIFLPENVNVFLGNEEGDSDAK